MKAKRKLLVLLLVQFVISIGLTSLAFASPAEDKVDDIAAELDSRQFKSGIYEGSWPGEADYTGSIVIGMVEAYRRTCNTAYLDSAMLGGEFINWINWYDPLPYYGYGDDALAAAMLSSVSDDPQNNLWRTYLEDFYDFIKYSFYDEGSGYGSTAGFISYYYYGTDPGTAVFYLAHHAVAAHYVDAADKHVWREAVHSFLAQVDDDSADPFGYKSNPVMALGVALWALAQTGPLDSSFLLPGGTGGASCWDGKRLSDLPGELASHQYTTGGDAGVFYWRFDHSNAGGVGNIEKGFTEDTIFGTMGLAAAHRAGVADYSSEIASAKVQLLGGINPDGTVYGHLTEDSPDWSVYAAEMVTGLDGIGILGDTDMDDVVDIQDVKWMAQNWLVACPCRADFDKNGIVNLFDYAILAMNWLYGTP